MEDERKVQLGHIAYEAGLQNLDIDIFIKFVDLRLAEEKDKGYLKEWAERFRNGSAWNSGDLLSRKAILEAERQVRANY